jgi:hypothetical protein
MPNRDKREGRSRLGTWQSFTSFLLLRLASISASNFEAMYDTQNPKKVATGVAAIIEGKNDKIIYRNESGDRRSERFRSDDPGCHGPTIAKRISV